MSAPYTGPLAGSSVGILTIHRGQLLAVAIIGVVLGIIGLLLPGVSLFTIAILFGIYLVAAGIFRINASLLARGLSVGARWLTGILGVLVVIAGVICLANPFRSLVVLAYVIGIGWIAEGVIDITAAVQGSVRPRWFGWVSGLVSIVAGIVTFVLPAVALATFVVVGSVLLLFVSVSTLMTLPRKAKVG